MLAGGRLLITAEDAELFVVPVSTEGDSDAPAGVLPVFDGVDEGPSTTGGEAGVTSTVSVTVISGITVAPGPEIVEPLVSKLPPVTPIPERATVMVPASGSSVGMSKES